MPRKKSVGGRAIPSSPVNKLLIQTQKVNRRLNQLERAGVYARYASKKVIRLANESQLISYRRNRKQKLKITDIKRLKPAEIRAISKTFNKFLTSKAGGPIGIKEIEKTTREKVKKALKNFKEDVSDQDVEEFYDMTADEDYRYIADKIGDSDLYALMEEAKQANYSENQFVETLNQYITVNNADIRKKAQKLYNKYVEGI